MTFLPIATFYGESTPVSFRYAREGGSLKYRFRNSAGVCPADAAYLARAAEFSGVSSIFIGSGSAPIVNTRLGNFEAKF